MNYVSYYRTLTGDLEEFRHDLYDQRKIVYDFLQPNDKLLNEFIEICPYSDCGGDRPILAEALRIAKLKGATFIVASLNRLGRSTYLINALMKSEIKIVFCDFPDVSNVPYINEFLIHIHAGIAQYGGFGLGNPENVTPTEVNRPKHVYLTNNQTDEFAMAMMLIIKNIQYPDIYSQMGIANALNAHDIKTFRGDQWTPKTVKNLLLHYYSIIPPQESIPLRKGYTMSHFFPPLFPKSFPPPLLFFPNTHDGSSIRLPHFDSSFPYVSPQLPDPIILSDLLPILPDPDTQSNIPVPIFSD